MVSLSAKTSSLVSLLVCVLACGGAGAASQEPAQSAPASTSKEPIATAPSSAKAAPPAAATEPAADAPGSASAAEPAPLADEDATTRPERNVKYIVNPDGMRVEVDGVLFTPKAEVVKIGKGSGVKLRVEVRAKDGKKHSLLAPKKSPLAFAGTVRRKGEAEPISDTREGDDAVEIGEKPVTVSRTWPDASGKGLEAGDELELMVGIWGVGADASSRRMLKKFCKVTLKLDKPKPRALVAPPDGVTR